jgi:hypothetical protein
MLWTWEREEDVSRIAGPAVGVAFLDQTVELGPHGVVIRPQRNRLTLPANVPLAAVVRVEPLGSARLDEPSQDATAAAILRTAGRSAVREVQVDFDATRSQRKFYEQVLRKVRAGLPPAMPLSITALVSWCSYDDWIGDLPVDEAVPMYFRMGPDGRRENAELLRLREPLCRHSLGVSTREARNVDPAGKRVYVFADEGWQLDAPLLAEVRLK